MDAPDSGAPNPRPQLLRPIERLVLRRLVTDPDGTLLAAQLHRSPAHVRRIAALARLPRDPSPEGDVLRPLERRVLRSRAQGTSYSELATRLRRSPAHVERIEGFARAKLQT